MDTIYMEGKGLEQDPGVAQGKMLNICNRYGNHKRKSSCRLF